MKSILLVFILWGSSAFAETNICLQHYSYGSTSANACASGVLNFYNEFNVLATHFINTYRRGMTRTERRSVAGQALSRCKLYDMTAQYQAIFDFGCGLGYRDFRATIGF